MSDDEDIEDSPESGPFCRHWHDPFDCDLPCDDCGHKCCQHQRDEACREDGCPCPGWLDIDDVRGHWVCTVGDDGWRHAELPGGVTGGLWSFHREHGMQAQGPEDSNNGPPDCPPDVVRWLVARPC